MKSNEHMITGNVPENSPRGIITYTTISVEVSTQRMAQLPATAEQKDQPENRDERKYHYIQPALHMPEPLSMTLQSHRSGY
jgi:hypothetical protein